MPVSHLGLTVSHLPSAASFWLSALQPLGYRFIGHQGDSIGLGIKDADFFISQGPRSATIAPTHIAFAADDRAQVRECYASALRAGGSPSGAPGTRNSDCSCFNAAVEDLDGNTIEFILRESAQCDQAPAHADTASQHSRVLTWQEGVSKEAAESIHQDDSVSMVSKAKSRSQTALDLASSPAKSVAEAPAEAPASTGSNILSALSDNITPKAILGGAIGAVAAGAIAYAFYQSEQDSARDEAAYKSSIAASERGRRMSAYAPTKAPTMRRSLSAAPPRTARFRQNYAPTESFAPPPRTHRNFSVTESRVGPRPPPTQVPTQAPTALKAIEARAFDEDSEIQAAVSRHTSRRPTMARSQTFDPSIYAPVSSAPRSRVPPKRSATMADEPMSSRSQLFLEGPKEIVPSSRSLRNNRDDGAGTRHDTAPTVLSHRSSRLSRKDDGDRKSSASHASSAKTAIRAEDQRRSSASHVSTVRPAQAQIEDAGRRSSATSQAGSVKSSKREGSRYEGSRHEGSRYEGSRHEGSTHGSRHEGSRHEGSKHDSSSQAGSRNGATRDPDSLSDASTIKASRRDSAAHIPLPPSKAPSKAASRITAAEYRLPDSPVPSFYASPMEQSKAASRAPSQFSAMPDSPVPSYYAPPMEEPLSSSRAPSQTSAFKVPLPASKPPTHYSLPAPTESNFKPSSPVRRRTSHASGSAAGVPLPASMASGVGYLDQDENDGLQDTKTVVPDDSISCIDISTPKPPRSDYSHHSRHSERSHRSHRTHQSSRSKHSHRPDEDKGREPGDAQTVLPEDSISSVGAKPARSEHSHRSHRSHRERDQKSEHKSHHSVAAKSDHKSHHSTRSRHSKREDEGQEKERDPEPIEPELPIEDTGIPLDAKTVLPEDSISSVGARPARSEHSHHSHRSHRDHNSDRKSRHSVAKSEHKSHHSAAKSDHKSHHSTRSRHSKREDDGAEKEKEPEPAPEPEPVQEDNGIPLDAKTVVPEDSISSVGARPARSEHSHHSHRSHRSSKDDTKSHHSSRSKHSKSHDEDKDKRKTASESGKSDVTVKPAKSRFSALTLPGRLRGKDDEKERKSDKRSVATFA